jgi:hypothetical protein
MITDLGSLGGNQNQALSINNRGQIVELSQTTIPVPFSLCDFLIRRALRVQMMLRPASFMGKYIFLLTSPTAETTIKGLPSFTRAWAKCLSRASHQYSIQTMAKP